MSGSSIPPLRRRDVVAALVALLPAAAFADGPLTAEPPRPRPGGLPEAPPEPVAATAPAAPKHLPLDPRLLGKSGSALVDVATGEVLDGHDLDLPCVPASVTKAPTALWALETFGADHRFATRLLASGMIDGDTLQGDLALVGGGDPALDTDGLAALARTAVAAGISRITGRFYVDGSLLPEMPQIDGSQPVHVAYNPGVSGLNLNFNRVFLEWKAVQGKRQIVLEARGELYSPAVSRIRISAAARSAPLFTWDRAGDEEIWTVSEPALGPKGGRWLPVRNPADYAGDVFRAVAAEQGLTLPAPERRDGATGAEIARRESAPLHVIIREMLKHSTNLTAEVLGLASAWERGLQPATLAQSGAGMTDWLRTYAGVPGEFHFANHSGLTPDSRVSARQTALILAAAERKAPGRLSGLLKEVGLDAAKKEAPLPAPFHIAAKTGTMNFVRGLAGYLEGPNGRKLAFALYAGDIEARARDPQQDDERPEGSRGWIGRAKEQERALLRHWLRTYAA